MADEDVRLMVLRRSEHAVLPTRETDGSAGYDLHSITDVVIPPRDRSLIDTGLVIIVPRGYCGKIESRSSLAWKHKVDVRAGVIDSDYRGVVSVVLANDSDVEFVVKKGDRVAQLVITKVLMTRGAWEIYEDELSLLGTPRGTGGFGSTGK